MKKILKYLPIILLVIWLFLVSISSPVFGKVNNVVSNNAVNFLPNSAQSTKVQKLESSFAASNLVPAIVVVKSKTVLSLDQIKQLNTLPQLLTNVTGLAKIKNPIIGPIYSKNHLAAEIIVQINDSSATINSSITQINSEVKTNLSSNLKAYVSGPGGVLAALENAFSGIDGILLYVAIAVVFIILLLVYRSVILPFIVLLGSIFALTVATFVVYLLAEHNIVSLNSESQGILSILVLGATTDYSLLIVSRFKEGLMDLESSRQAMMRALKRAIEPIAASASTVILALLCLLFSDLNSNKSLGPVGAIGIIFSFLATMTFLTSLLMLIGRKVFWPFVPRYTKNDKVLDEHQLIPSKSLWYKVAKTISKKYRLMWSLILIVLILLGGFIFTFKSSGVSQTQNLLKSSGAVTGQKIIDANFPAGLGNPIIIDVASSKIQQDNQIIKDTDGVYATSITLNQNHQIKVVNGLAQINAISNASPYSLAAQNLVLTLRKELAKVDSRALVGGETAVSLDTNTAAARDLRVIIPIVLVVILIVLIFLLRSILAPILLILTVILSFSATMGLAAIFFNHIFHFAGSDSSVPLFGFIFLVALGIDYNIFLISRIREESLKFGTRKGIVRGLRVTGSVITSAGLVLAATFGALAVIPILFLVQIAFIVAVGVILDTIIVRSLLVPSLAYDLDNKVWWPSKAFKK
jgi:RND superfamily putative drug exporter